MGTPTVSIIIPLYNKEEYIVRALESVLSQSYADYEIIVVDDGSSDRGRFALEPYTSKITYIWQENAGPGAARNRGVRESSGRYIAFLDADDYWLADFLRSSVAFLDCHPSVGVVSTAYFQRDASGCLVTSPGKRKPAEGPIEDFFRVYAESPFCCTGSVLLRKQAFVSIEGFREDLRTGEDVELWCCLGATTQWGYVAHSMVVIDRTDIKSVTRIDAATRLSLMVPYPDWERRILALLQNNCVRSYQQVRWKRIMARLKFLTMCGEYRQMRLLASEYCRKFSGLRKCTLALIARLPDPIVEGIRRCHRLRVRVRRSLQKPQEVGPTKAGSSSRTGQTS